jgi:FeS assembly SUF system protein
METPINTIEQKLIEQRVIEALHLCFDPEIPVNIYDLGLVYDIAVNELAEVTITMTLTTPHCPAAQSMPGEVQQRASAVPSVASAKVNVVWTPPWNMSMMSEAAKLEMGFM